MSVKCKKVSRISCLVITYLCSDIALLKKQKEMAMSGARLEAMQKMVARFRGVHKHEREIANSTAD